MDNIIKLNNMNEMDLKTKIEGLEKAIAEHKDFTNTYESQLTVTKKHYYEWSRGLYGTHAIRVPNTNNSIIRTEDDRFNRILNTDHLNIHNNSSVPDEGESDKDESDEEDDARLMLAIQLSLG